MKTVYIIGSLRNPAIPSIATLFRDAGFDAFDDWHGAGPHADDEWKRYEQQRGRSYLEALQGHAARQIFSFDKTHLDRAHAVVLALPAGKSGHLEFGYAIGQSKPGVMLLPQDYDPNDPENRWDVMSLFANLVTYKIDDAISFLKTALESRP